MRQRTTLFLFMFVGFLARLRGEEAAQYVLPSQLLQHSRINFELPISGSDWNLSEIQAYDVFLPLLQTPKKHYLYTLQCIKSPESDKFPNCVVVGMRLPFASKGNLGFSAGPERQPTGAWRFLWSSELRVPNMVYSLMFATEMTSGHRSDGTLLRPHKAGAFQGQCALPYIPYTQLRAGIALANLIVLHEPTTHIGLLFKPCSFFGIECFWSGKVNPFSVWCPKITAKISFRINQPLLAQMKWRRTAAASTHTSYARFTFSLPPCAYNELGIPHNLKKPLKFAATPPEKSTASDPGLNLVFWVPVCKASHSKQGREVLETQGANALMPTQHRKAIAAEVPLRSLSGSVSNGQRSLFSLKNRTAGSKRGVVSGAKVVDEGITGRQAAAEPLNTHAGWHDAWKALFKQKEENVDQPRKNGGVGFYNNQTQELMPFPSQPISKDLSESRSPSRSLWSMLSMSFCGFNVITPTSRGLWEGNAVAAQVPLTFSAHNDLNAVGRPISLLDRMDTRPPLCFKDSIYSIERFIDAKMSRSDMESDCMNSVPKNTRLGWNFDHGLFSPIGMMEIMNSKQ